LFVYLNGIWVEENEAKISVFDKGFMSAESVYETLRTYNKKVFALERHYERLRYSAEEMRISVPFSPETLYKVILEGISKNGIESEAYIRVQLSGTTAFVWVKPMSAIPPEIYEKGVKLRFSPIRRKAVKLGLHTIKTTGALDIFLSRLYKSAELYDLVLLTEHGYLAEGTFSNIFFAKSGMLFTPGLETGILSGITRETVLGVAKENGITTQEGFFNVYELLSSEEVFLTHTSAGIVPVTEIETRTFFIGEITRKLTALLIEHIRVISLTS
jgi:branched-chain amino acid aminotransferase